MALAELGAEMGHTFPDGMQQTPRVKRVQAPEASSRFVALFLLVVVPVLCVLGGCGACLPVLLTTSHGGAIAPAYIVVLILISILVACSLAVGITGPGRRTYRSRRGRFARLERVAGHPQAAQRLPHRLVELAYWRHARRLWPRRDHLRRELKQILTSAPRGTLVVVSCGRDWVPPSTRATPESFEPIGLIDQDAQAAWLVQRAWPELSVEGWRGKPRSTGSRRGRAWLDWGSSAVSRQTLLLFLYIFVVTALFGGRSLWHLMAGAALFAIAMGAIGPTGWFRRDVSGWVVPGAFVWSERGERHAARACDSAAVLEVRGRLLLQGDCRTLVRRWDDVERQGWGAALLMAAWTCTAAAPSMESIRSYLDSDTAARQSTKPRKHAADG
ncbi:MAG: hypothetical protein JXB13_22360 [Phycisphaerae bacterium]|nr:hypothetical protein [Phycisphaerae bacterium]